MKRWNIIFGLAILLFGCRKPYNPPAINSPGSYLVVEGVINSGTDSTIIKLSRTVALSSVGASNPVTGAVLTVEGDQNTSYPLQQTVPGTYVSAGLNLDNAHNYRLRVKTSDDQYVSDFEPVLNSPPIDSVNFTVANNGVNIFSNTHDPDNIVKYYRWDYQETWIFHSNFDSFFKSNGDTILARDLINDQIYSCWTNDASSSININSSAKLSNAVIYRNPITFIPSTSEKIGTEYSILVRQYALTADAYNFWTDLKKNTEQLGGIFDAQPSQNNGNIHSVINPSEPVIGYISVGATSEQRIFILSQQLPAWLPTPAYPNCTVDSFYYKYTVPGTNIVINQINMYLNYDKGAQYPVIPINAISVPASPPIGYTAAAPECVDCTLRGTNKPPSFWK